jgi:preprotein translocase subunit SecE
MNPTPRTIVRDLLSLLGVVVAYSIFIYLVSLGG